MRTNPEAKPLMVYSQTDGCSKAIPRLSVVSSQQLAWENIRVDYQRQPAWKTPEIVHSHYLITINTGVSHQLEESVDGKINSAGIISGDMFISPPGFCRQ